MSFEIVIGLIILTVVLLIMLVLTFWSRNIINHIDEQGELTARELLKGSDDGR